MDHFLAIGINADVRMDAYEQLGIHSEWEELHPFRRL